MVCVAGIPRKKPPAKSPTPNLEDQANARLLVRWALGHWGVRGTLYNYKLKINSSKNYHASEL